MYHWVCMRCTVTTYPHILSIDKHMGYRHPLPLQPLPQPLFQLVVVEAIHVHIPLIHLYPGIVEH